MVSLGPMIALTGLLLLTVECAMASQCDKFKITHSVAIDHGVVLDNFSVKHKNDCLTVCCSNNKCEYAALKRKGSKLTSHQSKNLICTLYHCENQRCKQIPFKGSDLFTIVRSSPNVLEDEEEEAVQGTGEGGEKLATVAKEAPNKFSQESVHAEVQVGARKQYADQPPSSLVVNDNWMKDPEEWKSENPYQIKTYDKRIDHNENSKTQVHNTTYNNNNNNADNNNNNNNRTTEVRIKVHPAFWSVVPLHQDRESSLPDGSQRWFSSNHMVFVDRRLMVIFSVLIVLCLLLPCALLTRGVCKHRQRSRKYKIEDDSELLINGMYL